MISNLVKHIRRFVELNEQESMVIDQYFKHHDLKKREFLLKEGEICSGLYFVEKGCLRMYFNHLNSREQITQFAIEGWWISDYFSFMDQKPSQYCLQTIEKSIVLSIDNRMFEDLLKEVPSLERYFRIIMQRAVAASQLRARYVSELSKEEFYQHFITTFPEFVQRVPQYMVASYLGLTPEYVSELRKKK